MRFGPDWYSVFGVGPVQTVFTMTITVQSLTSVRCRVDFEFLASDVTLMDVLVYLGGEDYHPFTVANRWNNRRQIRHSPFGRCVGYV